MVIVLDHDRNEHVFEYVNQTFGLDITFEELGEQVLYSKQINKLACEIHLNIFNSQTEQQLTAFLVGKLGLHATLDVVIIEDVHQVDV